MTNQEINEAVARKLGWYQETIRQPGWELQPGEKGWERLVWFKPKDHPGKPSGIFGQDKPEAYATSIEAAWEVVERFSHDHTFQIEVSDVDGSPRKWVVTVDSEETEAETAPLAICLAFLKLP